MTRSSPRSRCCGEGIDRAQADRRWRRRAGPCPPRVRRFGLRGWGATALAPAQFVETFGQRAHDSEQFQDRISWRLDDGPGSGAEPVLEPSELFGDHA